MSSRYSSRAGVAATIRSSRTLTSANRFPAISWRSCGVARLHRSDAHRASGGRWPLVLMVLSSTAPHTPQTQGGLGSRRAPTSAASHTVARPSRRANGESDRPGPGRFCAQKGGGLRDLSLAWRPASGRGRRPDGRSGLGIRPSGGGENSPVQTGTDPHAELQSAQQLPPALWGVSGGPVGDAGLQSEWQPPPALWRVSGRTVGSLTRPGSSPSSWCSSRRNASSRRHVISWG